MKLKTISISMMAVCMAMVSCDKNETMIQNNDGSVRFVSGITATPASRVAIDADGNSVWNIDDPVGIFMVEHGSTDVVDGASNVKYTATSAGVSTTFTPSGNAIFYPLKESSIVDFIAYYPYKTPINDFTYPIDLSVQTSQSAIDLMVAKADNTGAGYTKDAGRTNTAVNFGFTHQLVKLVINVMKDASVSGNITGVSINGMNTSATFDLKGVAGITSPGTPKSITPCKAGENKYEAVLLPVAALADAHVVAFTTDKNETYNWVMKKQMTALDAGKIYTYDVTVTKYEIIAEGTINRWNVGSTGTGTAE